MKNSEIMVRALAEATGAPPAHVRQLMALVQATLPPGHRLNDEVSADEAARLLERFHNDRDGIRRWLLAGHVKAMADGLPRTPTLTETSR